MEIQDGVTLMALIMKEKPPQRLAEPILTWQSLALPVSLEADGGLSERTALQAGDLLEAVEGGAWVFVGAGRWVVILDGAKPLQ